jgi:hypothetical protein
MLAKFEIRDLSEQEVQISSLSNFLDALLKGRNNGSQMLTVPLSIPTLENPSGQEHSQSPELLIAR